MIAEMLLNLLFSATVTGIVPKTYKLIGRYNKFFNGRISHNFIRY